MLPEVMDVPWACHDHVETQYMAERKKHERCTCCFDVRSKSTTGHRSRSRLCSLTRPLSIRYDSADFHCLRKLYRKRPATRFPGAPPSVAAGETTSLEPHAGGQAILNSEALRLEIVRSGPTLKWAGLPLRSVLGLAGTQNPRTATANCAPPGSGEGIW